MPACAPAVVIPVGPGDHAWQGLIPELRRELPESDIVLALCQEQDRPTDADLVRCIVAHRGRARQLNAGALAARGEHLWFLHADSRLHSRTVPALLRAIDRAPRTLGWFDLRFAADGPAWMRVNEFGVWWRSRLFSIPFGDQGLFLSRDHFQRLGGFDEKLSSAEDHALVWAARRSGIPLRAAGAPLYTSARRYAEHGWWQTTRSHLRLTWEQARRFSAAEERRP